MEEKLREILDMNQNAYDLTELVPASGLGLDRLAAVRQKLRAVHQLISALIKDQGKGEDNG